MNPLKSRGKRVVNQKALRGNKDLNGKNSGPLSNSTYAHLFDELEDIADEEMLQDRIEASLCVFRF